MKSLAKAVVAVGLMVLCLAPSAAQAATRVHLIQGIPDSKIDVEINGKSVINDLAFRGTYDLSSLSGRRLPAVKVKDAGTGNVMLDAGDVTLPAGSNVTVVLHLKLDGTPGLSSFENDVSKIGAGKSRLVIRHLAAAPAVDVVAAGSVVFSNLSNGNQVAADLAAGSVDAALVPAGTAGPTIVGPANLALKEGVSLIVYGLGSIEKNTMAVATETISGLAGSPTAVNSGNSAVRNGQPPTPTWVYLLPVGALAVLGAQARRSLRSGHRPT